MTRLVFVALGAVGLILFVAFVAARLVRSRTAGTSIRMQVFLALAGIVGAFAFGVGLLVLDRIEARATLLAREAAHDEALALAQLVSGEMETHALSLAEVARTLDVERRHEQDVHLLLLDASGHLLGSAEQPAAIAPGAASAPGDQGIVTEDAPINVAGRTLGWVRVLKPTIVMRRLLADFAPTVLVISVTLGAAAALAAALIGRAIATPIEGLTHFAVRVSEGETSATPPVAHGREVKRLTEAIDSMRRELEGRPFLETFAADLSHELKNPVAAIRASAELLEEGALAEPEEARRFVGRIREAVARIEALLHDILSLARIEARGVDDFAEVDIGDLARSAAESVRERGAIDVAVDGATPVRGQAAWLARAIDNLVDNALVHGEANGRVRVAVRREAGRVSVSVVSHGAVATHVQSRLFRRFVTTRHADGGTGLGLAIVRAVAEAHGGKAELVRAGPPEVEFRVTLPPA